MMKKLINRNVFIFTFNNSEIGTAESFTKSVLGYASVPTLVFVSHVD